jgi:hypothetical protein
MTDPTQSGPGDPVLVRRARVARLCELGQRAGYTLFAVAVATFAIGAIRGFTSTFVDITVGALAAGSVLLAPAIVFGYAVKAAEREDRERAAAKRAKRGS